MLTTRAQASESLQIGVQFEQLMDAGIAAIAEVEHQDNRSPSA